MMYAAIHDLVTGKRLSLFADPAAARAYAKTLLGATCLHEEELPNKDVLLAMSREQILAMLAGNEDAGGLVLRWVRP